MPNSADTAKFRAGLSADVLYLQFYAHLICDVETKISGRRRKKKDFTDTHTHMPVGLETENDLEDERSRRASALLLFSLSLYTSIQVWMSERQVSREDIAD